jgi:uncharacterized cofD-like protein
MYRFEKGEGITGMTFGNLFMAALSDILGSQKEAIKQTGKVLRVQGTVIPVSFTDTNLYAEYEDGHVLGEEHLIDEPSHDGTMHITDIYLKPQAIANPEALETIAKADCIVLGPGDLYTSLLPNLCIDAIARAIKTSKAKKAYVVNLMTKYGQTYNFTASDHVAAIEKYIGPCIDFVILNNAPIPPKALALYAKYHEQPVVDDLKTTQQQKVVRVDLVNQQFTQKAKSDTLIRSLIRHDSTKLATTLIQLIHTL